MLIDITLKITPRMTMDAQGNEKKALTGHLGTHFDVMNREFPLEYTRRKGICFHVEEKEEIGPADIDLSLVEKEMFVIFRTGFMTRESYGTPVYFSQHPYLSRELIEELLNRGVSLIGIDGAGIRRGKEHTAADQLCADRDTFVVENLAQLDELPTERSFVVHTYPVRFEGMTGLPCRVIAEV